MCVCVCVCVRARAKLKRRLCGRRLPGMPAIPAMPALSWASPHEPRALSQRGHGAAPRIAPTAQEANGTRTGESGPSTPAGQGSSGQGGEGVFILRKQPRAAEVPEGVKGRLSLEPAAKTPKGGAVFTRVGVSGGGARGSTVAGGGKVSTRGGTGKVGAAAAVDARAPQAAPNVSLDTIRPWRNARAVPLVDLCLSAPLSSLSLHGSMHAFVCTHEHT